MASSTAHTSAKVGDNVSVHLRGGMTSGTALGSGVHLNPGTEMVVGGRIVEDLGNHWAIELSISVDGKNRIVIPKSARS